MSEYAVIARFRQPGTIPFGQAIIELRQYGDDVARFVNGFPQEWTCEANPREAVSAVERWMAFERTIGSKMEQWVKLT